MLLSGIFNTVLEQQQTPDRGISFFFSLQPTLQRPTDFTPELSAHQTREKKTFAVVVVGVSSRVFVCTLDSREKTDPDSTRATSFSTRSNWGLCANTMASQTSHLRRLDTSTNTPNGGQTAQTLLKLPPWQKLPPKLNWKVQWTSRKSRNVYLYSHQYACWRRGQYTLRLMGEKRYPPTWPYTKNRKENQPKHVFMANALTS